jgi:DNA-binding IclR family transcriptional regulator
MSQFAKVLKVLDLFTEDRNTLAAEEIADLLDVSRPTAFRYVKQLCETGLLTKLTGRYALGARIIELDYGIRRSEPILQASREHMRALAQRTSTCVILCSVYDSQVVHSHHEFSGPFPPISLERGHSLPLFRSAPSTVILANLPTPRLKKLYEAHAEEPDVKAISSDWAGFASHYRAIRRAGYYVSDQEVDAGVIGISAPIFNADGYVAGSATVVHETWRSDIDRNALAQAVRLCTSDITRTLEARYGGYAESHAPAQSP